MMSRFPGNALRLPHTIFGSLAIVALVTAAPVSSAFAQVPHDMLLLDPPQPQPSTKTLVMTKDPHTRNAYARSHKTPAH